MKMSTIAFIIAALLLILGLYGFIAERETTALIPAGFGVMLAICGWMALTPEWRMQAMHGAAMVGLLGIIDAADALRKLPILASGREVTNPVRVTCESLMAALCLVFLIFCVRSFIQARRQRASGK